MAIQNSFLSKKHVNSNLEKPTAFYCLKNHKYINTYNNINSFNIDSIGDSIRETISQLITTGGFYE